MRRFSRTPYYTGPDDPARKEVRGTLNLEETVVIETVGGADGDLKPGVVPEMTTPRGSRPGGPFLIEGIQPGDWVAVEIIAIEVGPYGYYNNGGPFRGSLRSVAPVKDGFVHFPPDFVVPARPMIGVIQLAPATGQPSYPDVPYPWNHGGNMDFNSVRAGSTVHICAQRPGGLLFLGDVHARMSDGELNGTGVEIDSAVTLRVDRSPGFPCAGPVVETADEFLTAGFGHTWEDALRIAWTEMVTLVAHRWNTSIDHANLVVGTIADARPGYSAGTLNSRGFPQSNAYATVQLAITKELRRTGAA